MQWSYEFIFTKMNFSSLCQLNLNTDMYQLLYIYTVCPFNAQTATCYLHDLDAQFLKSIVHYILCKQNNLKLQQWLTLDFPEHLIWKLPWVDDEA